MMGRAPCCEKDSVKRGPWAPEEDTKLLAHIRQHGTGSWRTLPKKAGLRRCGKSCRLRWTNYLRPDLKHGHFTDREEQLIVNLHAALGSRWSLIAAQLPGRTDNDVKNYWNTRLKKKLCELGIDPITHKPISQLLADLAGSMALQPNGQSSELSEAALGCFKDDMLHVLMRKGSTSCWQFENSDCNSIPAAPIPRHHHGLLPPTTTVAPVAVGPRQSWDHMMNTMSNSSAAASPTTSAPALAVAAGTYNEQPSQLLLQEQASSVPSLPNDQSQLQQVQDTVWQDYKYNWTKAAAAQTLKQNSGASAKGREEAMAYNMRAVMCSHSFCGPTADHQLEGALGSHASFLTGHAGQPVGHLLPHQVMMTGITQRPPTVLDHSEQLLRPVLEMTVDPNNNNNSYHSNRACAEMMQNAGTPELELGPTSLCMSDMRDTSMLCKTTGSPWPDQNAGITTQLPSMPLPSISDTPQMFTGSLLQDMTSQEPSSCSGGSQCQESSSHKTSHAATMEPWSPSPSGISSCSSTSLGGADRGQGGLDQVLGSDVFLWDFSDFTCMMN